MTHRTETDEQRKAVWWRNGMVWLVIGGPAAVVVASLVTAFIAYHGADVVLDHPSGDAHAGETGSPARRIGVPVARAAMRSGPR